MSGRFSKSEIDRLGERIRAGGELALDDLRRLQAWRDEREHDLREVRAILKQLGFQSTARLKTHNTLVEKIHRERGLRLSRMQDVAGCRIVVGGGRHEQDRTVSRLLGHYPQSRVVDRREHPTQGYRAVHVIVEVDGWPVEIQVRTEAQDAWAQVFEQFADMFGRDLRYGGPPAITWTGGSWSAGRFLLPLLRRQVEHLVRELLKSSAEIDRLERTDGDGMQERVALDGLLGSYRTAARLLRWFHRRQA